MTTLVWFRDDLRIADHPALAAGCEDPEGIVALYLLDEESEGIRPLGGAARWWLHESLTRLSAVLAERGIPLILRRGTAAQVVPQVVAESGAGRVLWNRRYGAERHHDAELKQRLRADGVEAHSFRGGLLFEPGQITTRTGDLYRVYSPFWRACLAAPAPAKPLPEPAHGQAAAAQPASDDLADWELRRGAARWCGEIAGRWDVGEAAAVAQLRSFLRDRAATYEAKRDTPSIDAGSGLSPYLRWGEISPRTVWHVALESGANVGKFLSELGWREFAAHTAFAHSDLHLRGLDRRFDAFPWREEQDYAEDLTAWQRGQTGFPLVDAGMQELWRTGIMHNRVRMVVASFLTKNLLIDWRVGEAWFWDTLVDADAASNPFNWQWVAGCGVDSAPYFRVFNPSTQLAKFDPERRYADQWAPESLLHPEIVDLRATRVRALAGYDVVRHAPPA
ncbi:deoxyribodipyrimidine photo-lyase [Leucobacter exalbidus]|uniref:Deoxyribodipyrimidine photo-lyase n=1 Tax=Leucobacter exalbidus TaxID=662960 RepID=A0A940PX62_9MICO|nr:deoxyribodipyrimidine photo-lyase [Leucobacter exalbidus]MBP1326766.1 deoxyribodipyrimidine photo-lyase [Leucobacter exalbidus]